MVLKDDGTVRNNSSFLLKTLKLISVLAIVGFVFMMSGCVSKSDGLVGKVSKNIDFMTRDNPNREFNGEEVQPVTSLIDKDSSTLASSNSPDRGDVLAVDIIYQVKQEDAKKDSSILDSLPWNKPRMVLTTLIPKTIPNKQSVISVDFSTKPTRVFDVGENRYAEFEIDEILNGQKDIHINVNMQLFKYDLNSAMSTTVKNIANEETLKPFLKNETHIEKDNPLIAKTAAQISGTDEIDIVYNIFKFVLGTMTYDSEKAKDELARAAGAVKAMQHKKGVCVDYADLFIALCRAKGIPARYSGGVVTEDKVTTRGHAWTEVYLQSYGWVPFDPTWGDTGAASFYSMRPSYIYFTSTRNDEVIDNSNIFSYRYYGNREIDVDYKVVIDSGRMKYIGDMKSAIDDKRQELDQMKGRLNLLYREIEQDKRKLDAKKAELNHLDANAKTAESIQSADNYNNLALEYNQEIQSHNQKVNEYEEYRKYYESNRQEFNALIDKYNDVN